MRLDSKGYDKFYELNWILLDAGGFTQYFFWADDPELTYLYDTETSVSKAVLLENLPKDVAEELRMFYKLFL